MDKRHDLKVASTGAVNATFCHYFASWIRQLYEKKHKKKPQVGHNPTYEIMRFHGHCNVWLLFAVEVGPKQSLERYRCI